MTESSKEFENLRGILNFEFKLRVDRNLSYSLRAFARDLELPVSHISDILKGKKGLSAGRAKIVGKRIGYRGEKLEWFTNIVQVEFGRSHLIRERSRKKIEKYRNGVNEVESNSLQNVFFIHWYHTAIRRMTLLKDFQLDAKWISLHLSISEETAKTAIEDLLEHKLIEIKEGKACINENTTTLFHGDKGREISRLYRQELIDELNKRGPTLNPDEYRHAVHFFSISHQHWEEMKKLAVEFEDQIDNLTYKNDQPHDTLYFMRLEMVPFTSKPGK